MGKHLERNGWGTVPGTVRHGTVPGLPPDLKLPSPPSSPRDGRSGRGRDGIGASHRVWCKEVSSGVFPPNHISTTSQLVFNWIFNGPTFWGRFLLRPAMGLSVLENPSCTNTPGMR